METRPGVSPLAIILRPFGARIFSLKQFEDRENKKEILIHELKKGEESGFLEDFNRSKFLRDIRRVIPL